MISIKAQYTQLLARFSDQKKPAWGATSGNQNNLTSEIVNLILTEAIINRASDIHIETRHGHIIVRYRIDGTLHDALDIEDTANINIIPRIKLISNIPTDSVSARKAWDGRFSMDISTHKFDFRVATFPTIMGDKIAIRILNKSSELLDLKKIGLSTPDLTRLERIIQRKSGLILVTGPTGGGKTSTLYSILKKIHNPGVNIVTLEDPVEYQIDGINQCDIKNTDKEENAFVTGLKAILRQDPDVILVGEIRDQESADIALRASITGHLVLSSLHANSGVGTILRLINMGIERHVVSYALIGVVAQRLVRRICDHCKVPYKLDPQAINRMCMQCGINPKLFMTPSKPAASLTLQYISSDEGGTLNDFTFYKGTGCNQCSGTGFKGRLGVFEVLQLNDELRQAIVDKATVAQMEELAQRTGSQSLIMDAISKVKAGLVAIDDIYPILLERST